MGCHTWCYRKIERTVEQARQIWIEHMEQWIMKWQHYIDNPQEEPFIDMPIEQKMWQMELYKRQLRMVKKGLCTLAVCNDQPDLDGCLVDYVEEKGFYADTEFHDVFRIYKYEDIKLFSYEQCIEYIKEVKYSICDYPHILQEFWQTYPDGMIRLG